MPVGHRDYELDPGMGGLHKAPWAAGDSGREITGGGSRGRPFGARALAPRKGLDPDAFKINTRRPLDAD
jgi:hypothetical protein